VADNPESPKLDPATKNILIVEDDEHVLEMLKTTLSAEGFMVQGARDGRNIMDRARKFMPHLVISDVMMPGGGGYEVIRSLQGDPATRDIPVFIMTGYNFDETTKVMMKQEPNVKIFMTKPVRPASLLVKIHEVLHTKSKEEKMIEETKKNSQGYDFDKKDDFI
jgi:DNA-binding response OmpR family regulator